MTWNDFQRASQQRAETAAQNLARREITAAYREARDAIQAEIDRLYARVLSSAEPQDFWRLTVQTQRWAALDQQIADAMRKAGEVVSEVVPGVSRAAMANSYYYQQYALNVAGAVGQGLATSFNTLPEQIIELAVFNLPERLNELSATVAARFDATGLTPKYPGTLTRLLSDRNNEAIQRVRQTVQQTLIQGRGIDRMARNLTREIATTRNFAERIIRTETHRLRNMGHYAATQSARADGVEITREIRAVRDDRTRAQSIEVDGLRENADGVFIYPGGVPVAMPGNSGVAGWDINDRELVLDIVPGLEPDAQRVRRPGEATRAQAARLRDEGMPVPGESYVTGWSNFNRWAETHNLYQNRYGELIPR